MKKEKTKKDYVLTEREEEIRALTPTNFMHMTNYTSHDVQKLIDKKIEAAGLILSPVFAGMVGLSKMLYGDKVRPMQRFCKFAEEHMSIPEAVAKVLYKNVKGGLSETWMSKYYTALFTEFGRLEKGVAFYYSGNMLYINAVELGYIYIATIKRLQKINDRGKLEFAGTVKTEKNDLSDRNLDDAKKSGKGSLLFGNLETFKKKKYAA